MDELQECYEECPCCGEGVTLEEMMAEKAELDFPTALVLMEDDGVTVKRPNDKYGLAVVQADYTGCGELKPALAMVDDTDKVVSYVSATFEMLFAKDYVIVRL